MRRLLLIACLALGALLLGLTIGGRDASAARTNILSRDLGCAGVPDARGRMICRRLQQEMEWTWTGHAILSPGWRVTFKSVRRTYCAAGIGDRDINALEALQQTTRDWRAQSGADFLLRLLRNSNGSAHEDVNSIFNAVNPSYVLKGGCRA
jgi:hypothetical protein